MSKQSKHTPGPWIQSHRGMLCQISILSDEEHLATVYGKSGENKANANLITAAPDLLEALEELISGAGSSPGANKRYAKARAAIAKAKGES